MFFDADWHEVFVPSLPVAEIVLRGTIIYLFLFGILRFVLRREAGAVSITDLLVVVLLADASQNAMGSDYTSIPDGLLLVSTIVAWNFTLEWLGYRFERFERLVHPPPLPLVKEGQLIRKNMRRELVTLEELMTALRKHGLEDVGDVSVARMEGDGTITVIARDGRQVEPPEGRPVI